MIAAEPWMAPLSGAIVRVVIADRGRLFRESLAEVLASTGRVEVLGTDGDDPESLERIAKKGPDLMLISTEQADETLLTRLRELRANHPDLKLLVLALESSNAGMVGCIEAGAVGCLLRGQSLDELRDAVRAAATGEPVYPIGLAGSLFRRLSDLGRERRKRERLDSLSLTARELEILQMLAEGRNNKEIAQFLCLSIHTVKNHIHRVLEVLGVHSRWEAAKLAVTKGWVPDRRTSPYLSNWPAESPRLGQ